MTNLVGARGVGGTPSVTGGSGVGVVHASEPEELYRESNICGE